MDSAKIMKEAAETARKNREAAEDARAERLAEIVKGAEPGPALSVDLLDD